MDRKHLFTLSLTLIIVMLFSALGPTTVYADDGTPPDTTTVESSGTDSQPADEGDTGAQTEETGKDQADSATTDEATTEAPAADQNGGDQVDPVSTEEVATEASVDGTGVDQVEPVATEEVATEAPVDETAGEQVDAVSTEEAATEATPSETGTDEADVQEPSLVEQVPDNTEIVVINEEGNAEPLATQDAAEAVAASDPIWCPAAAAPGDSTCTGSFSSFDALLTELQNNASYSGPGTIYVEMGTYSSGETSIDFNNYTLDNIRNSDLTIQGGWNTGTGTTTDTTTFSVPMVIGSSANPWGGSLTLNNIIISGVVGDVGLSVYSNADVTVNNSTFTNNDDAGAVIHARRNVTVTNTNVSDNGSNDWNVVDGRGLEIRSGGFVTLNGVVANINQLSGADIQPIDNGSISGVAIANSTFNGNLMYTNGFTDFFGYGLTVVSQGDIALSGVEGNENFLWGASLTGPNVFIENSTFNLNVSDSVSFIDDTGLIIVTTGDVALDNIQANQNRMIGANIMANGQVDILNSSFDGNFGTTVDASGNDVYWGYGLQIGDQSSPVAGINLTSVTADNNYLFGANLYSAGDVNINNSSNPNVTRTSNFSNNASPTDQGFGLMVESGGLVALSGVTASNNRLFGANITATDLIDITDSIFGNNGLYGLSVTSSTGINLVNVNALGNGGDGAYAEYACVFLNGGAFTGNGGYGLNVFYGNVDQAGATTYANNTLGDTNPNPFNPCDSGGVIFTSPSNGGGNTPSNTVTSLTQNQLPGALGQGNTFVSAFQVTASGSIQLSFPIPAGMETSNFAVMFWDGTKWVEVPGGSVVNGAFVITVTQPGIYVLVAQFT